MFNKTKTIEKLAKAVVEAALSLYVCVSVDGTVFTITWRPNGNGRQIQSVRTWTISGNLWHNLAPAAGFLSVYTSRRGCVCGGILRTQKSLGAIAVL